MLVNGDNSLTYELGKAKRQNNLLVCQLEEARQDRDYYGGMIDRIREILDQKHLDGFQKEVRIKQLLGMS